MKALATTCTHSPHLLLESPGRAAISFTLKISDAKEHKCIFTKGTKDEGRRLLTVQCLQGVPKAGEKA